MKRHFVVLSLMLCWAMMQLSIVPASFAQTSTQTASALPRLVRFGGTAKDGNGNPLTGVVGLTFALYSEQTGGAPLWLETQNVTPDGNGHYLVLLGSTRPDGLPTEIFTSEQARWVGVQMPGQAEQPRVLLVSAAYALKAGDAETIGGLPPSAFVLAVPLASPTKIGAPAQPGNATPASDVTGSGTADYLPLWTSTSNIGNSVLFQSGTAGKAKIGINTITPASTLDVKGAATVRGLFSLPAAGTATATKGYNSEAEELTASAFNSGTGTAVTQNFQWQVEPLGNDSSTASGALHLLFGQGTNKLTETGLNIASNGQITFATGQTFPGTGDGTVTSVGSGGGLTGGPITTTGTLSIATGGVSNAMLANSSLTVAAGTGLTGGGAVALGGSTTLNLASNACASGSAVSALPFTCSPFATLGANNFSGNEGVTGNVTASGEVQGGVVNATTSFDIGGTAFAFGSTSSLNSFLGFAGNSTMSGAGNVGVGYKALYTNSTGQVNVAAGDGALVNNVSGSYNTASGADALYSNSKGSNNTASGIEALFYNTTGTLNTALGAVAGPDVASTNLSDSTAIGANATVSESNALVLGQTTAGSPGARWVNVGIGTAVPRSVLEANVGVAGGLGPTVTLTNSAGGTGSSDSFDFNTYSPFTTGTYNPAARITAVDAGNYSDGIYFQSNIPGAANNGLQTNMAITSGGQVLVGETSDASDQVGVYQTSPEFLDAVGGYGFNAPAGSGEGGGWGIFGDGGRADPNDASANGGIGGIFYGGSATSGSGGDGIYVLRGCNQSTCADAAYFDGNVEVYGNLSKSGGSFKIDHPLDPANKYLYHSFVESPDMMNIYNGNVTTDAQGSAVVTLPDWFETLNRDFRYQVTVIGQFAQAIVSSKVANNQFSIKTDKPNVEVSWQVTGVRQDSWANAHRIPVEVEKDARERGHYIHPELYGASEQQSIEWARHPALMQRIRQVRARQLLASQQPAVETRVDRQPLAVPPNVKSRALPAPQVKPASGQKGTTPRK